MASGVNVKMGVSGVAQFKQSINQAKQSVKTLDAQIALSENSSKRTVTLRATWPRSPNC